MLLSPIISSQTPSYKNLIQMSMFHSVRIELNIKSYISHPGMINEIYLRSTFILTSILCAISTYLHIDR